VRGADRALLAALARTALDLENPVSLFSAESAPLRAQSIAIFREAATCDEVAAELREPLAAALWALHLGLLLRFVTDESPGQTATRKLMEGALDLVPPIVIMLGTPLLAPLRAQLLGVLSGAGLLAAPAGE
jgi:hypothetical protein